MWNVLRIALIMRFAIVVVFGEIVLVIPYVMDARVSER